MDGEANWLNGLHLRGSIAGRSLGIWPNPVLIGPLPLYATHCGSVTALFQPLTYLPCLSPLQPSTRVSCASDDSSR